MASPGWKLGIQGLPWQSNSSDSKLPLQGTWVQYLVEELRSCMLCCAVLCHLVVSDSSRPHGLQPTRLLCPRDSPGKNTGEGSHVLLQGIFPTQGSNACLPHCRQIRYRLSRQKALYAMQHSSEKKKKRERERERSWTHSIPPSLKQHRPIIVITSVFSGVSQRCSHCSSSLNSC